MNLALTVPGSLVVDEVWGEAHMLKMHVDRVRA
jgi:hypothetical protein